MVSFFNKINYFTVAEASAEVFWPKLRFLPKLRLRPKQEKSSFGRTLVSRDDSNTSCSCLKSTQQQRFSHMAWQTNILCTGMQLRDLSR